MTNTVVIGAGVVGTTTAYYLAREGLQVTVVDAAAGPGLETSFANGGLVTPSTAFPWSSPGTLKLMLSYMGRDDAPLLLRRMDIPKLGLWGLRFALNCRPAKYRESARLLSNFARESLEELEGLLSQSNVDYSLSRGGLIQVYRDKSGVQSRDLYAQFLERMGIESTMLDSDGIVELEPSLRPIAPSIRAGLLLPNDAWGNARQFSTAIDAAGRSLGVTYRYGVKADGLRRSGGSVEGVETSEGFLPASRVVLCGGPFTPALLASLGISVPICPVKGYSISLGKSEIGFLPNHPIVDDHAHLGITPLGDQLRIAGTVEFAGFDRTIRPSRIDNLKRAVLNLFPEMKLPDDVSPWAGLRPMTPDGLPVIDATGVEGLYINSGHGALGWTLACASARLISALITGREVSGNSPFRLNRSYW